MKGAHEFRGGYGVNFLYLDHWQPETDNPRGRFDYTTRNVDCPARRRADEQPLQPVRVVPARVAWHGLEERPGGADDRPRMAARPVHPRPLDGEQQDHARPRSALGVLPDHAPRQRSWPRAARSADAGRAARRQRQRAEEVGLEAGKDNFAPRVGARLSHERSDRVPHRLRRDLQPDGRGRGRCAARTTR